MTAAVARLADNRTELIEATGSRTTVPLHFREMQTDELIEALAAEAPKRQWAPEHILLIAVLASAAWVGIVFSLIIGLRSDLFIVATSVRFLFKLVVTITVAASALALARRSLNPTWSGQIPLVVLLAAPWLLALAAIVDPSAFTPSGWSAAAFGRSWLYCLTAIAALGLVPLGLLIAALRRGAPTRPRLAGACAGALAGGVAATFYAANCPNDSPLFVVTLYPIAIGVLVLLGGALGSRFLRW